MPAAHHIHLADHSRHYMPASLKSTAPFRRGQAQGAFGGRPWKGLRNQGLFIHPGLV